MAKLPGRRAVDLRGRRLGPALLAAALVAFGSGAPDAAELEGTWHVLVHYTDENTGKPDQLRWDDRVWVFSRNGRALQWKEYPIVVFEDESGRFERRSTGQYARVLGAWEPSEEQLANIRDGLKINTRGSKTKTLRGSDEDGWHTTSRARAASASVITYQENWSIGGLPERPVFVQEDVMGSARSETLEGVTRWETTEVQPDGTLRGRFERDGTRRGTFVMRRTGEVGRLEPKSQREIQAQGVRRGLSTSQVARREVRAEVEAAARERGVSLSDAQTESITARLVELFASGVEDERLAEEARRAVLEEVGGAPDDG